METGGIRVRRKVMNVKRRSTSTCGGEEVLLRGSRSGSPPFRYFISWSLGILLRADAEGIILELFIVTRRKSCLSSTGTS
jgi:hypothetical protein